MSNMNPDQDQPKSQSSGQSPPGGGQAKDRPQGTEKDRTQPGTQFKPGQSQGGQGQGGQGQGGQGQGQMGSQHRDDKGHGQPGK
jgi:hypothetical protein